MEKSLKELLQIFKNGEPAPAQIQAKLSTIINVATLRMISDARNRSSGSSMTSQTSKVKSGMKNLMKPKLNKMRPSIRLRLTCTRVSNGLIPSTAKKINSLARSTTL